MEHDHPHDRGPEQDCCWQPRLVSQASRLVCLPNGIGIQPVTVEF